MEIPFFDVSGSAFDVGVAIGKRFRDRIGILIARVEAMQKDVAPGIVQDAGDGLASWCRRLAPHLLEEMRGYADGAGVALDDILRINATDQARSSSGTSRMDGCTGFVLLPEATGGPLLCGQSKDGEGPLWEHYIVLASRCDGHAKILQLAYPGYLSLLGLSETGMAICTNQIYDGVDCDGLPTAVLKRLAWDAGTVAEVEELVAAHGVASATNFLFCDRHGGAVCLEMRAEALGRVEPVDGVMVHTNHFLSDEVKGHEDQVAMATSASHRRRARMLDLFAARRGSLTVADVFECYRDHEGGVRGICSHATADSSYQTTAVLIYEPQAGRLHVSAGNSCRSELVCHEM